MKSPLLMLTGVSLIALSAMSDDLWFDWFGLGMVAIGLLVGIMPPRPVETGKAEQLSQNSFR